MCAHIVITVNWGIFAVKIFVGCDGYENKHTECFLLRIIHALKTTKPSITTYIKFKEDLAHSACLCMKIHSFLILIINPQRMRKGYSNDKGMCMCVDICYIHYKARSH